MAKKNIKVRSFARSVQDDKVRRWLGMTFFEGTRIPLWDYPKNPKREKTKTAIASSGYALLAMTGCMVMRLLRRATPSSQWLHLPSLRGHEVALYGRGNLEFRTGGRTPFEAFPEGNKKSLKSFGWSIKEGIHKSSKWIEIALIRRSGQNPFELSPF